MAKTTAKKVGKRAKKSTGRKPAKKSPKKAVKKWSAKVNQTSDALDLKANIFKSNNAGQIAASLKRSAEASKRRKGTSYQSAMSMLNFYINRGGKNLSASKKKTLESVKSKLRTLYGK